MGSEHALISVVALAPGEEEWGPLLGKLPAWHR